MAAWGNYTYAVTNRTDATIYMTGHSRTQHGAAKGIVTEGNVADVCGSGPGTHNIQTLQPGHVQGPKFVSAGSPPVYKGSMWCVYGTTPVVQDQSITPEWVLYQDSNGGKMFQLKESPVRVSWSLGDGFAFQAAPVPPASVPFYKKWWFWAIVVVMAIMLL